MKRLLRLWLLVSCLLGAQLLASAHGAEHLRGDADVAAHACVTCLAAQGLDAGLPSLPLLPLVATNAQAAPRMLAPCPAPVVDVYHLPTRGPPHS